MEFDKSRVYTSVNADEVKVGSKGYLANSLESLKEFVSNGTHLLDEISEIVSSKCTDRFSDKNELKYNLFYLVKEPKENKFRPFKNTDDMMIEFCRRSGKLPLTTIDPPVIYFKNKISGRSYTISAFDCHLVKIHHETYDMVDLFNNFTFNDGSPCGIEE